MGEARTSRRVLTRRLTPSRSLARHARSHAARCTRRRRSSSRQHSWHFPLDAYRSHPWPWLHGFPAL